jgi:dihydrofolate synthase/folylpolyglutamate synthase
VDFVNRIKPSIEEIRPSFFEITVAMAFDYFARQQVDIAVVEVGLGGRLDSTNIITPLVSVITNISWDHKDLLGNTLEAIAGEKAGIIKHGIPVVISERQDEVQDVFINKARDENAEIFFASDQYAVAQGAEHQSLDILKGNQMALAGIQFPLGGFYQRRNIPGVMQTLDLLKRHLTITSAHLKKGLEDVVATTGLLGRWQKIYSNPTVVCDTAHNSSGVQEVLQQVSRENYNHLFIIWGMVKDKDVKQILALLPQEATYYFCQAGIPRAMDAQILQQEASAFGLHGEVIYDVNQAKRTALARAMRDDFIFIGGSTYVVAEIDEL